MALGRKEKIWLVVLVVAVGIASFLAGRLSVIIEQLQIERPLSVVRPGGDPQIVIDELGQLIRLSQGPKSGPSITKQ